MQEKNCRLASTDLFFFTATCCDVFNIGTIKHGDYIIAVALQLAILRLYRNLLCISYIFIWPIVQV